MKFIRDVLGVIFIGVVSFLGLIIKGIIVFGECIGVDISDVCQVELTTKDDEDE